MLLWRLYALPRLLLHAAVIKPFPAANGDAAPLIYDNRNTLCFIID